MEEAAEQYAEAARLSPDDPASHRQLGLTYQKLGRDEEAAAEFRESCA